VSLAVLDPVLVANRGEIAVRVARTARALGLRTCGVFTADDAGGVHLDAVDEAARVPSYLDVEAILAAATRLGARSVHPGYGFLSENARFARAVAEAGLTWIGPPASAIELMGDKARARRLAQESGVPVVPGLDGEDDATLEALRSFAGEAGYPIVIKAVAGGGGKGMRVVRAERELGDALDGARREAESAFGDARVLAERYLERPRHVEVQVLADAHGTAVHLGERECSLQRRHQKVVEEAPSPVVDEAMRERMGTAAVALAQACGYVNAGTVEFIVPHDGGDFFFLEMNTRLQVEHPVTELVYGVDLVEQQLRIAANEPLRLRGQSPRSHAVEARIYAEDPAAGFLPATGTVRGYREPEGVRVDSGIREGSEVGTRFDPMLAKVIAHGPDRPTALARLDRALADLVTLGVTTNAAFTRQLLRRDDVRAGEQDTGLIERILAEAKPETPDDLLPAAVAAAFAHDTAALTTPPGPWLRRFHDVGEARATPTSVTIGDRTWTTDDRKGTDPFRSRFEVEGVSRAYAVHVADDGVWVARDGHHLELRPEERSRGAHAAAADSLEAPMPGTVLLVHAENGDAVEEGQVLLVLESMKMELSITAPHAGTVEGLELKPGDSVKIHQPLVAVTAA
jgi:acetyl-CoA/propionyl-CoA carboxylase biotin carboxyl carrier protein